MLQLTHNAAAWIISGPLLGVMHWLPDVDLDAIKCWLFINSSWFMIMIFEGFSLPSYFYSSNLVRQDELISVPLTKKSQLVGLVDLVIVPPCGTFSLWK